MRISMQCAEHVEEEDIYLLIIRIILPNLLGSYVFKYKSVFLFNMIISLPLITLSGNAN